MLGEYLAKHRKEANLSIEELSSQTRIRLDYIKALENDNFAIIPGEVYVKGYIKTYLGCLSINPKEALELFDKQKREKHGEHGAKEEKHQAVTSKITHQEPDYGTKPKRHPLISALLLIIVLSSFIYFFYNRPPAFFNFSKWSSKQATSDKTASLQASSAPADSSARELSPPTDTPADTSIKQQDSAPASKITGITSVSPAAAIPQSGQEAPPPAPKPVTKPVGKPGEGKVPSPTPSPSVKKTDPEVVHPVTPVEAKKVTPEPEKTAPSTAHASTPHSLVIVANAKTWFSIKIDNGPKKAVIMNPGDTVNYSAAEQFSMRIGNAGGVNITFDGKELGAPGRNGEVINISYPKDKTL